MTPQLKGYDFRSNAETFVAGATTTIRSDYLTGARGWTAPEITSLAIVFTGTVAAPNSLGGALGRDFAKLFATIKMRLQGQDVYFLSGAGARVIQYVEYGGRLTDTADVAQNTSNATYRAILEIPFACHRSLRPRDSAVALADFLDSGEFTLTFAPANPTGWPAAPAADWRVQVFAKIVEGRKKELKTVRRLREVIISNQELSYDIGGFLRGAYLTSALATTGYTSLAGITAVNSTTLGWPAAYQTFMLTEHYRQELEVPSTLDEALLAAPGMIPLVWPDQMQKIGRMPDIRSLHLDILTAPPTGLRLLTDVLIDRSPDANAKLFGYDNSMQAAAQVHAHGVVVGAAGNFPIGAFNADLQRKMPTRVKPGGVARS